MHRLVFALLLLAALPAWADDLPTIHLKVVGGLGQTDQFKEFEEPFWSKSSPSARAARSPRRCRPRISSA